MALTIGDNFSYMGAKPLDGRLKYDTVASMKAMADSVLYDGCLAYCVATGKTYQWKSTNDVDATLGRWREFESGGSGGSDNVVEGYYKEADGKFYEEDTYETEIVGEDKVLYISLDTNLIYRWDGSEFVVMSSGGGSEYTAGDGIVIENDEISTDNMPAADMSEVASPMPSVMSRRFKYSTEEQIVGEWIDGKSIYQKTVNFGHSYDSGGYITKTLANLGISNVDIFMYMEGIALGSNGASMPVPESQSANEHFGLYYSASDTSITIYCTSSNWRNRDVYITLRYTKTTD